MVPWEVTMLGIRLQLGIWGFKASRHCFYAGHREKERNLFMGFRLDLSWSMFTNGRVMGEYLKQLESLSLLHPAAPKKAGKDRS